MRSAPRDLNKVWLFEVPVLNLFGLFQLLISVKGIFYLCCALKIFDYIPSIFINLYLTFNLHRLVQISLHKRSQILLTNMVEFNHLFSSYIGSIFHSSVLQVVQA